MDRTERFYKIDALLQGGRAVHIQTLLDMLEVSRATFKRDIEYMRDRLNYPIVWDREQRGYRYEQGREDEAQNLPGLWFNEQEAYALLMMQAMLSDLQPTLLKTQIEPLKARLRARHFVHWYNVHHRHSGIRYVSPAQRHAGQDREILAQRHAVYLQARERNPSRWSRHTRNWSPIETVALNPERDMAVSMAIQPVTMKKASVA
jgi:predicted DNA-binding transcriptional regulator YafY